MFQYSKHARRQLAQGIGIRGAVKTETGGRQATMGVASPQGAWQCLTVEFTSLPGTRFKYSKRVRRQLAQGIEIQGAVET